MFGLSDKVIKGLALGASIVSAGAGLVAAILGGKVQSIKIAEEVAKQAANH